LNDSAARRDVVRDRAAICANILARIAIVVFSTNQRKKPRSLADRGPWVSAKGREIAQ